MSEIVYNVTVNVSDEIHDEWVDWMRDVHIPEVLGTGMFVSARFMRVHALEQGGKTYATAYTAESMERYERYLKEFSPALRAKTEAAFGDHVHAFRTMLEVLASYETRAKA